jgi:hypothetical protein
MGKLACVLLITLSTAAAPVQQTAIVSEGRAQTDDEHSKWVDHVLRSISTIKPGMTRRELLAVFKEEGGLSTRTQRRYVYKHCPYIKVEVNFAIISDTSADGEISTESPDDKIAKISRPFLEYSIMD